MILLAPLAGWRPGFSLDFRRARNLARYGILVSANDIVVYVRNQAANFILGRTMGAAPVGLFNKADSLSRMPHGLITGSVYQVIFRAMAKEQDDLDKSHYLFFRSLCLVSVYVTPFYLMAHWIADPLITFLYGAKWAGAAAPLAILALAGPFLTIGNMSGAVLAARNWLGKELRVQLILLGLVIIATFSGLPYGLQGVAAALVVVAVYNAMHMYSLAARCLGTNWMQLLIALRPAAILNAIFACTLFLLHHTMPGEVQASDLGYLAAMIITGILVYALCFLFLPISALRSEQERWKTRLRRHGVRTP
jgi:O-antigen/teichoic acid export membrane protein